MATVIDPTIGRVVWYYPHGKTQVDAGEQPLAAVVAHVHGVSCVNLAYFDSNGVARNQTSVRLVQEGEELPQHGFCCWMPYQRGQALKVDELAKRLEPSDLVK